MHEEILPLASPSCPACGEGLQKFPGTEDSEVLEIEVKAYRRVIRRQRYRPACSCGKLAGIVTAAPPGRLIERGKFGISVWVDALLDKFLYGRASTRWIQAMADRGLEISAGSLSGGLQAIAPLFAPLYQALLPRLREEPHWHADGRAGKCSWSARTRRVIAGTCGYFSPARRRTTRSIRRVPQPRPPRSSKAWSTA